MYALMFRLIQTRYLIETHFYSFHAATSYLERLVGRSPTGRAGFRVLALATVNVL